MRASFPGRPCWNHAYGDRARAGTSELQAG